MTTARLAEFAATLEVGRLPESVRGRAALLAFDLFATALFVARRTPWGKIITALAREELRGPPAATVIGSNRRTSAAAAALANGTLAMGFEYEDTHPLGGHPFSIAFPAALAVGQWRHRPAAEVLAAAAAGYEVEIRLRRAARVTTSSWPDRGLYPVTLFGVFGAAAAAGRAADLSPEQMTHALGIAGSHAFGTMQAHAEGTMTRRLHGGKAAEVGVVAALLARRGFSGPAYILEGEYGFFRTFAGEVDLEAATAGLGEVWALEEAWLKRYPVNGLFQAAVEALRTLQAEYGFRAEDVQGVEATIGRASRLHAERDASSVVRAQFSLPVALALTLRYGAPRPEVLLRGQLDTDLGDLAERITVTFSEPPPEHPEATRFGRILVRLRDGSVHGAQVLYPKGHPRNALSWEDVRRKYDELLPELSPAQRERLAAAAAGFPRLGDSWEFLIPLPRARDG